MSMEQYFCDSLELSMDISAEAFDRDAFLADLKSGSSDESNIETRKVFGWSYGSLENPEKEHSHIFIDFRRDKIQLRITYHGDSKLKKIEDVRPPYMEDCAQWLGSFINSDEVSVKADASFIYKEDYIPIVALPYPLLNASADLSGAQVVGVKIKFPVGKLIKNAIVQKIKKGFGVHIDNTLKINLKNFNLNNQLHDLSIQAMKLVVFTGEKK